ncbi:hypothetical protein NHP164001_18820 [Helicobacter trogontum]|uniref:YceI family protein n=1 Tax=Helicobacter trogontum TaxID=50960 RepID=A0ABQ0D6L1_9HELI|nr:hypothetical protein [Helicobacter trogontum]
MKKIMLTTLYACSTILFAAGININTAKLEFEGYKTPDMVGTKGSFKNVKYNLGKNNSTITGQLQGARAIISPNDIDMGDDVITTNIIETFFKVLNSKRNFSVEFKNITEGNNIGSINAILTIDKESVTFPLFYSIEDTKNGKFIARGRLSLDGFSNAQKALKALSEVAPGHMNLSWPIVDVVFSADMSK